MIQIPKGSVHIDIRELNLSINYLGETGLGRLKSQPGPAVCLGLTGSGKGPARRASHPGWDLGAGKAAGQGVPGQRGLCVPVCASALR